MRRILGFTLIEIILSLLILAFAIIPVSNHLGKSSVDTRAQQCENEAMQFACDKMDSFLTELNFDNVTDVSNPLADYGKTQIQWEMKVVPVPLNEMPNFNIPSIKYHTPCYLGTANSGKEKYSPAEMVATISTITDLDYEKLDKERLDQTPSGGDRVELKDLKLTVKWRIKGTPDNDSNNHTIVLISRRARL